MVDTTAILDYKNCFGNIYLPEDMWWTFDTTKGIKIPLGIKIDNPEASIYDAPMLGDDNPHMLLAGAVGSGVHNTVDQLIVSLVTMYAPSELNILYTSLRGMESGKFMTKINRPYLSDVPQMCVISGTDNILTFIQDEIKRRCRILSKYDEATLESMRSYTLEHYNLEFYGKPVYCTWNEMRNDWEWYKPNVVDKGFELPRLLIILDEFQDIYKDSNTHRINGELIEIFSHAREVGIHLLFVSQSLQQFMLDGIISSSMLRCATRCNSEISNMILGSDIASSINAKSGYLYSSTSKGSDNTLWNVPFAGDSDVREYISKLNSKLSESNEKRYLIDFLEVLDNE